MLAGCAHDPPRPLNPARHAARLSARGLDGPGLHRFLAAMGHQAPGWNLATLTLVAVYERPEIRIATADLALARGGVRTAASLPNPTLALTPTFNASQISPSPWQIGPLISFLVDSLGARPARIAAARAEIGVAQAAIATAAWGQRRRVRTALLVLWQARRMENLASRAALLAARIDRLMAQRLAAGMVAAPAATAADLAVASTSASKVAAHRQVVLARADLAAALGLPVAALRGVRLDFAAFAHPYPPRHLAARAREAMVTRPDVQAALARYRVAEAHLAEALAGQYPQLRIGPGYHYDQGANKYLLAISLPLPILNQNQGPIAMALAARRVAAARFDAVQQQVLAEIGRAEANWPAALASVRAASATASLAGRQLAQARVDFAAGAIGRLALLRAEAAALAARAPLLRAETAERRALGALEDALHHRYLSDGIA